MKLNTQIRKFLEGLNAAGINANRRADFGPDTSVWQFDKPGTNKAVFAILRTYRDSVGFGLYIETGNIDIADDVTAVSSRLDV